MSDAPAETVSYTIRKAPAKPELRGFWSGPVWSAADTLSVDRFCFETLSEHPRTQARLLYDADAIYVHFRVEDQYVHAEYVNHQEPVYRDSCVEAFIEPRRGEGYFNFETNCGGAMLLQWGAKPDRRSVDVDWIERIELYHSLPERVMPRIEDPILWHIEYAIPLELLEEHAGPLGDLSGQTWHANFYKCMRDPEYRHYATWAPLTGDAFHSPEEFGPVTFE